MRIRHVMMMCCGLSAPALVHAASPTMEELEAHLANLQHEYNRVYAQLHVVGLRIATAEDTVQALEAELADNPKDLGTAWRSLQRARAQLAVLLAKQGELQDELIILLPRIRRVQRLIEFLRDQDDPGD